MGVMTGKITGQRILYHGLSCQNVPMKTMVILIMMRQRIQDNKMRVMMILVKVIQVQRQKMMLRRIQRTLTLLRERQTRMMKSVELLGKGLQLATIGSSSLRNYSRKLMRESQVDYKQLFPKQQIVKVFHQNQGMGVSMRRVKMRSILPMQVEMRLKFKLRGRGVCLSV